MFHDKVMNGILQLRRKRTSVGVRKTHFHFRDPNPFIACS